MSEKRDILLNLQSSVTGRAIIFFAFAVALSFLVVVYGLLKEQEFARTTHRAQQNVLMELKTAYQDYETALLMHIADPGQGLVSDARARFTMLEKRLTEAERRVTGTNNRLALGQMRAALPRINPSKMADQQADTPLNAATRDMLMTMTAVQDHILAMETALDDRSARFEAGWTMHSVAQLLMGLSSVALLLLIGRLLMTQSDVMKLLRLEKDTADRQAATQMAAIEASRDGVVILDNDGRIVFMNRAFSLLHFLSAPGRKEFIGRPWADLYNPEGRDFVLKTILPTARDKGFWHGESRLVNSRGQSFTADLSLTALPADGPSGGGFIGTAQDTREKTERARETEELRHQYYQAQKMESLGRLAGGIAHDFNNILAAITGYSEFLIQDLPKESATSGFAQKILQAASRAKGLIEQILNFSRANEQGRARLDLAQAITEVLSLLKASLPSGIEVETRLSGDHIMVEANPTQVSQALMNLCVNAQDAMDGRGTLSVTLDITDPGTEGLPANLFTDQYPETGGSAPVHIHSVDARRTLMVVGHVVGGQRYARLAVKDSGTGIPRTVMEHMFEPFFTTKDVHKGTGLGLASVHGILLSHRGFLVVDTTFGAGSSFQMFFPLAEAAESAAVSEDEGDAPAATGGRILVVDDQDDVRTTMCLMLQRAGFEVFDSQTPAEGLDLIRDNPDQFDLVITDYSMPHMTGVEFAQKAGEYAPDLTFMLVSGYAESDTRARIAAVPAIKDIIKKPVQSAELADRVRKLLG